MIVFTHLDTVGLDSNEAIGVLKKKNFALAMEG